MSHAVITGNHISGTVTLPDGREVDVTDYVVYVDTAEDAQAVADAIEAKHRADGTLEG